MFIIWVMIGSGYYTSSLCLKNVPGDFEKNGLYTSIFDIVAIVVAGCLSPYAGIRKTLIFSGMGSIVSSSLVISLTEESSVPLATFYTSSSRFFLSYGFAILYMKHAALFPTFFLGTSLGMCHFGKGFAMFFMPMVAEAEHPWPNIVITICNTIWTAFAFFIIEKSAKELSKDEKYAQESHSQDSHQAS